MLPSMSICIMLIKCLILITKLLLLNAVLVVGVINIANIINWVSNLYNRVVEEYKMRFEPFVNLYIRILYIEFDFAKEVYKMTTVLGRGMYKVIAEYLRGMMKAILKKTEKIREQKDFQETWNSAKKLINVNFCQMSKSAKVFCMKRSGF